MNNHFQVGDILEVSQPIVKGMRPEGVATHDSKFHVLVEKEDSMCNSDGEDWWLEWETLVLETGRKWRLSSRHNIYQNIRKVS